MSERGAMSDWISRRVARHGEIAGHRGAIRDQRVMYSLGASAALIRFARQFGIPVDPDAAIESVLGGCSIGSDQKLTRTDDAGGEG